MRALLILAIVFTGGAIAARPADAQSDSDEGSSRIERWHPAAFEQPSRRPPPSLELQLDPGEPDVLSVEPGGAKSLELQDADRRIRRARIGIGASAAAVGVGAIASGAVVASSICFFEDSCATQRAMRGGGAMAGILIVGGLVGMIVSGVSLRRAKKERTQLLVWARAPRTQMR